ncbi:Gfo/Idh/MocA family protein [Paenibacillus caui]|uniref:Gfo/Idh/MocA family protein n=1 Tax=Paenibacillus caui TaxID=2873927 RepID=UPI001CA9B190|nr:Gfo/Idh/MocA family oxidoreductase [Paenibacillus caui]
MIHFAIVGCGHIANKHIEAIQGTDGARLLAVCDTNAERLEETRRLTGAAAYSRLEDMLESEPELDVVCICTPSGLHAKLAIQAAEAGKHLIIEKPMALSMEDGQAILEAVRRNRVKAAVVHPNRYRPAIQHLKEALDRGIFGKLGHVSIAVRWNRSQAYYDQAPWRGTKEMDGGVLMNQAIHSLDLLLWLFGPIRQVCSMTDTRIRRIDAEDTAVAVIRFESGALGTIEAATTVYESSLEESISVFGENGYAVIGGVTAGWIKHWKCGLMSSKQTEALIQDVERDPYGVPGHRRIVEGMVEALRYDREPAVTVEDGLRSIRLVHDILNAAEGNSI